MKSTTYVLIAVAAIVVFVLLWGRWSHLAGHWPYLLLPICPLVHLFHGHERHRQYQHRDGSGDKEN